MLGLAYIVSSGPSNPLKRAAALTRISFVRPFVANADLLV